WRILANDDVLAAGAEGVAAFDCDGIAARIAYDFHTANNAPSVEVAIVQLVLFDNILSEQAEIVTRQKLSGEESPTAETLRCAAGWTAGDAGFVSRRTHTASGCHGFSPLI